MSDTISRRVPPKTSGIAYEMFSDGVTSPNVACRSGAGRSCGAGDAFLLRLQSDRCGGEQRTLLRIDVLLRLAQRGLRGVQVRIGMQRLINQAIE